MSSIPSNCPIIDASIFEYKNFDKKNNRDFYKLNTSKLPNNECHMFYPAQECEEFLIANALEFITFNPANKEMNDKFNVGIVKCGSIILLWCRFPREFKDVCERAAKLFHMTMKTMPRAMIALDNKEKKETALELPEQDNVLCFQGERCNNPAKISIECDDIAWVGNCLEKLGID